MGPMGPVGLDFGCGQEFGVSRPALAELLPAAEIGLMRGLSKRATQHSDTQGDDGQP